MPHHVIMNDPSNTLTEHTHHKLQMRFAVKNICGSLTAFYPNVGKPCVFALAVLRNVIYRPKVIS